MSSNLVPNPGFDQYSGQLPTQWFSENKAEDLPYIVKDPIRGICVYLPAGNISRLTSAQIKLPISYPLDFPVEERPAFVLYGQIAVKGYLGCKLSFGAQWTNWNGPYSDTLKVANKEAYFIKNWSKKSSWTYLYGKIEVPKVVTGFKVFIENGKDNTGPVSVDDVYVGTEPPTTATYKITLMPAVITGLGLTGLIALKSTLE